MPGVLGRHLRRRLYSSFQLARIQAVPELSLTIKEYEHVPTGARYINLQKPDDPLRAFGVAFRTPPTDSTGVPHILEHTVLCGSLKYPVKDPFFRMLKRSMACYMNAWTGADLTMYPFATTDALDYNNLRDIYVDAVFRPLLREADFRQEGWHLGETEFKGVVFNEMKGALSDPEDLFSTRLQQALLPRTPYAHVSGGDPLHIPHLSHAQLQDFWRRHYHPSNACVVAFGSEAEEEMAYLVKQWANYQRSSPGQPHALQSHASHSQAGQSSSESSSIFNAPQQREIWGPAGEEPRLAVSWLLPHIATDPQACFNWQMLSHLLVDGPHTPLHQRLLLGGRVGREWSACTGFSGYYHPHGVFTLGLQAIKGTSEEVEGAILAAVQSLLPDWQPSADLVEATLHQLEMSLRLHQSMQGLQLAQACARAWSHGLDLAGQLGIEEKLKGFRRAWRAGELREMVAQLPTLPHRLTLTMLPDPAYSGKLKEAESLLFRQMKEGQGGDEPETKPPAAGSIRNEDELLPRLDPLTLPHAIQPSPFNPTASVNHRVTAQANGIGYLRALLPLPELTPLQWLLLPSLCSLLTQLGVRGKELGSWEAEMRAAGAGFSLSPHLHPLEKEAALGGRRSASLLLTGHGLESKWTEHLRLIGDTLLECNWNDPQLLHSLIQQSAQAALSDLASHGHSLAATMASARLQPTGAKPAEWMEGLSQVQFLQRLAAHDPAQLAMALSTLWQQIRSSLSLVKPRLAVISSSSAADTSLVRAAEGLLERLGLEETGPVQSLVGLSLSEEGLLASAPTTTAPVMRIGIPSFESNYTAWTVPAPLGTQGEAKTAALLQLACSIIQFPCLHTAIREEGGAYGVSANYSANLGQITFTSYRDPQPQTTLQAYRQLQPEWNERALREAQLAIMAKLERPMDVGWQFVHAWMDSRTDEYRQAFRTAVLTARLEEVQAAFAGLRETHPGQAVILGQQGDHSL